MGKNSQCQSLCMYVCICVLMCVCECVTICICVRSEKSIIKATSWWLLLVVGLVGLEVRGIVVVAADLLWASCMVATTGVRVACRNVENKQQRRRQRQQQRQQRRHTSSHKFQWRLAALQRQQQRQQQQQQQ